jgi:hypothetical protein
VARTKGTDEAKGTKAAPKGTGPTVIAIPPIELAVVEVPIVSDEVMLINRWSEKATRGIARGQNEEEIEEYVREKRKPEEEYEAARYRCDGWDGVRADGIRKSLGKAAYGIISQQKLPLITRNIYVIADGYDDKNGRPLCRIYQRNGGPIMDVDHVKLPGPSRTASLCYRPLYREWYMRLRLRYTTRFMNEKHVLNLVKWLGHSIGFGENRPERKGQNGMFHIASAAELRKLKF